MKLSFFSLLSNRFFIAVVISAVLIYFLPEYFAKHGLQLADKELIENKRVYYNDLDGDGKSEKITYYYNLMRDVCYMIHTSNGSLKDQYNFEGKFTNDDVKQLWFLDADNNGYNEIYNLTQRQDSVFLNITEPFLESGLNLKNIFIDVVSPYSEVYEVSESIEAYKLSGNSNKVAFVLYTGFSANPRHLYLYNIRANTVKKSPHLVNKSKIVDVVDLNQDGFDEIILEGHSTNNAIDSTFTKRLDNSSWLTVLNKDLDFYFNPVQFEVAFSSVKAQTIYKNGKNYIVALFESRQNIEVPSKIMLLNNSGKIVLQKQLKSVGKSNLFVEDETIIVINRDTNLVSYYDFNLQLVKVVEIQAQNNVYSLDVDNDGIKEWLHLDYHGGVRVFTKDFTSYVEVNLDERINERTFFNLKQLGDSKTQLHLQKSDASYLFEYSFNPLYPLKYLIYGCVYGLVLTLVWLIQKGQTIRMKKQRAIEDEIAKLQLKTIKNQVDPHFVFNAINTISEMTLMDNKLEADLFISRFSGFMRDTLKQSDKISTTLKEELHYVENFIKLQQMRYDNAFEYQILVANDVDVNELVPKHVLFTYVENAIKYGVGLKKDSKLWVDVRKDKNALSLIVQDNGTGSESTHANTKGTGNGVKIMEKIFKLYSKLHQKKITYNITDLAKVSNKKGWKIEVRITN